MNNELLCLAIGAGISFAVSALKGIDVVKNHPKVIAGVFSALAAGITAFVADNTSLSEVVTCTLTQFVAAIGTHEAVVHPVKEGL